MPIKRDFEIRLQCLVTQRECALTRREASIAKRNARSNNALNLLKNKIIKQCHDLESFEKQLQRNIDGIAKLRRFLCEEEVRIQQTKQQLTQLQEEEQLKQIEQQKLMFELRDRLHVFKRSTKMLINVVGLPELIQGVTLREKEHFSQLVPFCIDPLSYTQREVQNQLWESSNNGVYSKKWKHLIFDCFESNKLSLNVGEQQGKSQ